ncbi:MAG TPA: M56 family metallopeptidase [Bryobacteraceae bacterium]|jgi:TonB family protein|nr:M56 family metallopeptidase [Bryobacteraceae bacterium]
MLETYLISVGMKSTILLATGLLLLRCLRGQSAAVRHLVCLTALASAAVVPMLALWAPQWGYLISVPASRSVAPGGNSLGASIAIWPLALAGIWMLGALALAIRAAGGWIMLLRVRRQSVHFQNGDSAEVRIANVSTPLTCGVLRPVILLPSAARDWHEPRLRAVLLHETAHVVRRDCLAKYVAQASRAFLWWNPLAWMMAARLDREQELACDDAVLSAGVSADAYAKALLDVARECSSSLLLGCAMNASSTLHERLARLFERREAASSRRTVIAIPLLLALMTTVSFAEKIYRIGPGIAPPKILEKTEPHYTKDAKEAKIEGTVQLTMVVGTDQRVHDIKVTKSLDLGLDANAIACIRTWRFQPAMKDGKAVPVQAKIEVNFHLR